MDVNVHPTKQEVKFGAERQVFSAVYYLGHEAGHLDVLAAALHGYEAQGHIPQTLTAALEQAYANQRMVGKFPGCS